MKNLYFLLCLFSFTSMAAETSTEHFFNDKLVIELSTEFNALSDSALDKRYGKQKNPPAFAFSDKDKSVSFTFTQYSTPADKKSMNKIHKSLSNVLRKANDKARWKKDKVYSRLGTKVAVFEYEIKSIGKYQFNLTYVLPVDGKLTFISFTTTDKKYKNKWLALARESMDSIKLKGI
ncbi:hypothetical protein EKO29_13355 [Colwellia sp. Arc7-635]|uniref:hypothetical protein n=1 Tax=Colwellia sp. Arc7-635 TaxID=2497879 RepID=UPI000F8567C8|nr:hypothetical protein [Colwellia sp. Arc7-635]AZQ84890.1 hypothetical protein EKO29_13355 [Colwellia sp. Arc7-635]